MGAAALRHVEAMVARGREPREALRMTLGSLALDCLRAVMPPAEYDGRESYLVNRAAHVLAAIEGDGWALLTSREVNVALCVRSFVADPISWDEQVWERALVDALEPYRAVIAMAAV